MTQKSRPPPTVEEPNAKKAKRRLNRTGGRAFWVRTGAVAIFDALVLFAIPQVVANESWTLLVFLVGAAIGVNWAYLSPWASASRWLTPGLVLMAVFVVYPVVYTTYVSFTNWRTGNILTKDQVVENLEGRRVVSDVAGESLALAIYRGPDGALGFLVGSGDTEPFFGSPRPSAADPVEDAALDAAGATLDPADPPDAIGDYQLVPRLQLAGIASDLEQLVLDLPDGRTARLDTLSSATASAAGQRFTYDGATGTLFDAQEDRTCRSGGGVFLCDGVPEEDVSVLEIRAEDTTVTCSAGVCDAVPLFAIDPTLPGWRTVIGFDNYRNIVGKESIRAPFLRVLTWNVVFAIASVVLTFGMGLGLAIALQDEGMRGRPLYRSIYILPYAIPGFLAVFVWRGLLNDEFGKVNGFLNTFGIPDVNWLGDTTIVMAAVLLVNLWLGFPYMFLISSGALTSVPDELLEAARVDGSGPWRSFRSITLPLLLVSTAPLLIGSFAFNFNNFLLIFLLTEGGPPLTGYDVPVGATDLLISFTFKLAQASGRGAQFALASAIIVVIFLFLAAISAYGFRLTKKLEEIYER